MDVACDMTGFSVRTFPYHQLPPSMVSCSGDLARLAAAAHGVRERQQRPAWGRVVSRTAVLTRGVELVEEALRDGDGAGGEQAVEQEHEGVCQ
jgi:type IV secretory pathway TrbL component